MEPTELTPHFKDFLKLLNENEVEYLLVGGFAVVYYGHMRFTGDLDLWVAISEENADRIVNVYKQFGFDVPNLRRELFLKDNQIVRIGVRPFLIEVITSIDGVEFSDCYPRRVIDTIDGVLTDIISKDDLKTNKLASGRHKDLDDLDALS